MPEDPSLRDNGSDPSLSGRCKARNRRGEQCRAWAVRGATVCVAHGGAAPQVRAAAARRVERARLESQAARLLDELELQALGEHPVNHLLDACARCKAMVVVYGSLVAETMAAQEAYGQWLERLARAAKLALDAGIDERRVRMAEEDAARHVAVITHVLRGLGVMDRPEVPRLVREAIEVTVLRDAG